MCGSRPGSPVAPNDARRNVASVHGHETYIIHNVFVVASYYYGGTFPFWVTKEFFCYAEAVK